MSVTKGNGSEVAEPVAVSAEPDGLGDGEAPAGSSATDQGGRLAGWRRGLGRVPVWVAVEVVVVVVALLVALATRSGGDLNAATTPSGQQLVTVTRGTLSDTVSAQGTVAAANTANLSFTASGTVTAVNVSAGQEVTAGQVLATMNSAQLQAEVESAQATLTSAQAKVSDDASSGASSAQQASDQAALTSDNDSLDEAITALAGASLVAPFNGDVAQVNVTAGEQLSSGGTGGTSLTGSGSGSGKSSSSTGSSSSSGVGIGGAGAGSGSGTGAGGSAGTGTSGSGSSSTSSSSSSSSSPAIEVTTPGTYTASLPVSSTDIANVAVGQHATLTVTTAANSSGFGGFGGFLGRLGLGGASNSSSSSGSATGATATGTVTAVSKVASASSGVAQYPVTVSFTAPQTGFYSGASVIGAIAVNSISNVILVPTGAVTTSNGKSTVELATKGTLSGPIETRAVTTGPSANGFVEITSGLKEGDQVVVTTASTSTAAGSTSSGSGATTSGGGSTSGAGG